MPRLAVTPLEDRTTPAVYTLDPTFSGDGIGPAVRTGAAAELLAPLPDGGFLAVGRSTVARYTAGGEFATAFGSGGVAALPDGRPLAVAATTDGGAFVLQRVQVEDFAGALRLTRLLPNGQVDPAIPGVDLAAGVPNSSNVSASLRARADGGVTVAYVRSDFPMGNAGQTASVTLVTVSAAGTVGAPVTTPLGSARAGRSRRPRGRCSRSGTRCSRGRTGR